MFSLISFFPSFTSLWSPQPGAEGTAPNRELGLWTPSPDPPTSLDQTQAVSRSTPSPFLDANFPPALAQRDLPSEPSISGADRVFWDSLRNLSRNVEQVLHERPVAAASLERLRQVTQYQRLLAARYPIRPAVRPFPVMTEEEIHCDHWDTKGSWSSLDNIATEPASSSAQCSKATIPAIVVTNADEISPVTSEEGVKTSSDPLLAPPGFVRHPKICGINVPRNRHSYTRYGGQVWNGPITFYHEELAYFIPCDAYDKPNSRVDVCNGLLQRVDVEITISRSEQAEIFAMLCAKQPAFVDVPVAFVEYPEYSYAIMAIRQKHSPSLGNLIRWVGSAPMTMRQVQRYSSELAIALGTLSALGIVHRDIRPENVLVTPEGPIALSSFHFATQQHDGKDKLTESLRATGFLAPEMVSARRTKYGYDGTSDIWAFGMVMLDMITGQVNVSAVSSDDLERYNLMMPYVVHHLIDAFVDNVLANDLLHSILQEDPLRRPSWDTIRNHPFFLA